MKYCSNCGDENEESATSCQNCGKSFSILNKIEPHKKKENILFIIVIIAIISITIAGTYAFILYKEGTPVDNAITENNTVSSVEKISNNAVWHKIGSYNGINDDIISINTRGSKIKVVTTGMPIKNYADNSLTTILNQGSRTIEMSQMSWNSRSAVATKTRTIEVSGSGSFEIVISAYELQWWTVEVYEYY